MPLAYLTIENSSNSLIQYSDMGNLGILLAVVCGGLVLAEIVVLQLFEIFKVNLEMRVKLRSDSRMTDLLKVTAVGVCITSTTLLLAMNVFPSQGCVADYFNENSICKSCRELVHPLCAQCDDRASCS